MKNKVLLVCLLILGSTLILSGAAQAGGVTVTFNVRMNIQMLEGKFQPGSGDIVSVNGSFNNWTAAVDTLKDPDGDSVYTKTVPMPLIVGDTIYYKFWKTLRSGVDWEGDPNRMYVIASVNDTIPVDYFNRDSVYVAPVPVSVTFQVNMRIKMEEGAFLPGSGDIVRVAGSFNDWGNSTDTLTDPDHDSIYTKTVSLLENSTVQYKFLKTLRAGLDWEHDPNREYAVPVGGGAVPADYFDRDSVFTPPVKVAVTFQVNMRVKMLEGVFLPGSGDIVRLAGDLNNWGSSTDTMRDANGDSIYTTTDSVLENQLINYKFLKTLRGGLDWESGNNRQYTVPAGGGAVPVAYFDYDSVFVPQVTANVLWQVDMTTYEQLGWFRPDLGDTMQLRGPFNGWGGSKLDQSLFTAGIYQLSLPIQSAPGSDVPYKFFMQLDSPSAAVRFPGYGSDLDGVRYDHPAVRGDGNRQFNVANGGDFTTDVIYFSDINPNGIIPAGDTVRVTVTADLAPALAYIIPINPATDTVKLIWHDALSRFAQAKIQGSFPDLVMSHSSPTDTMYSVSFNIIGPAHYNMQYTIRYVQPGGSTVDQGGGLGSQNLFISRFIQPLTFGKTKGLAKTTTTWPGIYSTPVDVWQKSVPLPHEDPPFPIVNGVNDKLSAKPTTYRLLQNYPNPFNPTTRILYAIPERGHVTLKVYNLLGQEIATLVNQEENQGNYVALFEANRFPSGVYFYQLKVTSAREGAKGRANSFTDVKKMVLMK
jgi:transcription antitermination factor NusG